MSLKAFHIVFILLSIGLALGLGIWALKFSHFGPGVAAFAGAAGLGYYLLWFVRKARKLGKLTLFFLVPIFYSRPVWACAVCFGDPNSSSSKALKIAVLFLLGVVVSLLGVIASVSLVWALRAQKIGRKNV